MSGGLRLLEQSIASTSRGASYAGETIAMQRAGSPLIDMWPNWSQYQAMVTISGVGDGEVTRYDMAAVVAKFVDVRERLSGKCWAPRTISGFRWSVSY
jgi:hypothetical protein